MHVHTAPQIVKIESRFITTIDVVHYLALLARLFTCTHSHTRSRTHIGLHQLTYTITQSHIHSESHTRTLLHTITTQTHKCTRIRTTYIFTRKYRYSLHSYTCILKHTLTIQYNHTRAPTHMHAHTTHTHVQTNTTHALSNVYV